MRSRRARRFRDRFERLPSEIQEASRKAFRLFRENPAHPSLNFKRLTSDPRMWSARVTRDYRAVGLREGDAITWFWIGRHEEFDRQFPS